MAIKEELILDGDSSGARRAVSDLGKSINSTMTEAILKADLARRAFSFISDEIKKGIGSAITQEKTLRQQAAALEVFGISSQHAAKALEAQSTVLERMTGISQEEIRTLQNRALALGIGIDRVDDFIRAAVSLSNVMGRNVNETFNQLIKSQSGMLDETLASIPAIKNLTIEQRKLGGAVDIVNQNFGKFLDLETKGQSLSATVSRFSVAWGNLAKELGNVTIKSDLAVVAMEQTAARLLVAQTHIARGEYLTAFGALFTPQIGKLMEEARSIVIEQNMRAADEAFKAGKEIAASIAKGAASGPAAVVGGGPKTTRGALTEEDIGQFAKDEADIAAHEQRIYVERLDAATRELAAEEAKAHARETILQMNKDREHDIIGKALAENEKIREEFRQQDLFWTKAALESVNTVTQTMVNDGLAALNEWAEGGKFSGAEFARGIMKGIGAALIASGTAHLLQAAFTALVPDPAFAGKASSLAALGGMELALGSGLYAGNIAMARHGVGISSGSAAAGTESGLAPGAFTGGAGSGRGAGGNEPAPIIINFHGPTTKAEVGVAIRDALREAAMVGV